MWPRGLEPERQQSLLPVLTSCKILKYEIILHFKGDLRAANGLIVMLCQEYQDSGCSAGGSLTRARFTRIARDNCCSALEALAAVNLRAAQDCLRNERSEIGGFIMARYDNYTIQERGNFTS